jgi:hypothetical protein
MALTVLKTRNRSELDCLWQLVASENVRDGFSALDAPGVGDGTTAGNLRTTAAADYRIAGVTYNLVATDDFWDLSAEVDTAAGAYRAYRLYVDAGGVASFAAGTDQTSEAYALAALPALDEAKSHLGTYVAGPSTDFDDPGGLAAQGTVSDGVAAGAQIGVPGKGYLPPTVIDLVHS